MGLSRLADARALPAFFFCGRGRSEAARGKNRRVRLAPWRKSCLIGRFLPMKSPAPVLLLLLFFTALPALLSAEENGKKKKKKKAEATAPATAVPSVPGDMVFAPNWLLSILDIVAVYRKADVIR